MKTAYTLVTLFANAQGAIIRVGFAHRPYVYEGFDSDTMTYKMCQIGSSYCGQSLMSF
jgi:hypothetical protein